MLSLYLHRLIPTMLIGLALSTGFFAPAASQELPTRPIIITSPYGGGGSTDFSLRTIAHKVEELAKLTVIIESRPGGGGTVAAQAVKSGTPDGTRLLLVDVGTFGSNVTLFKNLAYDPIADFKPITPLWYIQNVLAIPADSPINSIQELVDLARKKNGGLTYASPAAGASGHLLGSMLAKATSTTMINVPFRGALAAATEVVASRVDFCFCSYSTIRGFVESKKLKVIALAADRRDPLLPDVPTTKEAGYPGLEMDVWFGIVAPAGTPDATVNALNEVLRKAVQSPDVAEKLNQYVEQVMTSSPAEFKTLIANEIKRYRPIVINSGAQIE
jgi:tripartite-type tricarboxylate transporter receptor subunit TctC